VIGAQMPRMCSPGMGARKCLCHGLIVAITRGDNTGRSKSKQQRRASPLVVGAEAGSLPAAASIAVERICCVQGSGQPRTLAKRLPWRSVVHPAGHSA